MSVTSYENGEDVSQITWEYKFKANGKVDYYIATSIAGIEETGSGNYRINSNTLTMIIDGECLSFAISKSDADNLHLKITEDEINGDIIYRDEIE